jgi:hypothetical protein
VTFWLETILGTVCPGNSGKFILKIGGANVAHYKTTEAEYTWAEFCGYEPL